MPAHFKQAVRHASCIVLACSRGPALEPFVVTSLVQLLCRTTKLCWFDDDAFRNIVDDAKQFLEKVSLTTSVLPCTVELGRAQSVLAGSIPAHEYGAELTLPEQQVHQVVSNDGVLSDCSVSPCPNNRARRAAARDTTSWDCASW